MPVVRRYTELEGCTFLLGVGGMKCATSWIFDYLAGLDCVAATPLKELHFFNAKLDPQVHRPFAPLVANLVRDYIGQADDVAAEIAVNQQFQAAVDALQMRYDDNAYLGHFARLATPETRVLCEFTPQYALLGPEGFDHVHRFFLAQNLNLKLLFVMRDPVERLWSHLRSLQQHDVTVDILTEWPDLIRNRGVIERSDYWQTIEALDAVFGPEQILYLFYEDVVSGDALQRLCDFAEVPYRPADLVTRQNETGVRTPLPDDARARLAKVLAPQYRFCRARFGTAIPETWG